MKRKFFFISGAIYLSSLLILGLTLLDPYQGIEKYRALNVGLTQFLLLTLFFAASNALFAVFYQKMKKKFNHRAAVDEYEEQLEGYHSRIASLIKTLQEGVLILDNELNVVMCNDIAQTILGVKLLSGEDSLFFHMNSDNETLIQTCHELVEKSLKKGTILRDSVSMGDAHKVYLDLIASPIANEPNVILILQDNSSDYKMSSIGKDFVANASHELRTPVTIIKGFAETLRDLPVISEPMLEDITDKIIRSCQRMNGLVKHLLLLADLDHSGKLNMKPCDLVSFFESCSYSLLVIHPDVCIETLQNRDEIFIMADPDVLEQAVMNLFNNAAKYSNGPAHITVTIEERKGSVTLRIEDKGLGISEEHLPHIFDRFYRVNKDRSRKLGGTGLGLSIVRSIIEKHHGKISVTSEEGKGTSFTLTFQAVQENPSQESSSSKQPLSPELSSSV